MEQAIDELFNNQEITYRHILGEKPEGEGACQHDIGNGLEIQDISQEQFYSELQQMLNNFMTMKPAKFRETYSELSPQYLSWEEFQDSEFGAAANVVEIEKRTGGMRITHDVDVRKVIKQINSTLGDPNMSLLKAAPKQIE